MFNKYFKKVLLDNIYVGYRVRKAISINTEVIFGLYKSNVYEYTYLSEGLAIFIAEEKGKFFDINKKVSLEQVSAHQLISKHLAYGDKAYSLKDYPNYNKDSVFGVYGVRPLRAVYLNLFEEAYEVLVSNKKDQVQLKNEYVISEAEQLVKKCNKILGNTNNILAIPPVKLDLNDSIKSVFGYESDFYYLVDNKTPEQVVTIMKLKVKEYEHDSL